MRMLVCAFVFLVSSVGSLLASPDTTVVIENDAIVTFAGQKVEAPFVVTMTDTNITINGHEVVNVRNLLFKKLELPAVKPSMESRGYINWLTIAVMLQAEKMVEAGEDKQKVWAFMKDFLEKNTKDSKSVSLVIEDGNLWLRHSSSPGKGVMLGVPGAKPAEPEFSPKQSLDQSFSTLCDVLRTMKRVRIRGGGLVAEDQVRCNDH